MTTRRYLTTATAPFTPATLKDTYNDSTLSTNVYSLAAAKSGTNTALARAETSTTNNYRALLGRWVSGPLTGGYTVALTDGLTHTMARLESSASANMNLRATVWVTVGDSDTVRGYLLNPFTDATEFAITTATNFSYSLTFNNSFTIQPGDRIVIELGYNAANTSATSFTGTLRAGGTAGDLATTGTTASTTNSPWIDFTGSAGFDAALVPYVPALPNLRGEVSAYKSGDATDLTLTLPVGTQVGDTVVLVHQNNWFTLAALATPTGTAVTNWVEKTDARYDGGTDANHSKTWVGTVTTAGAQTVIANWASPSPGDEERYAQALVFIGAMDYDNGAAEAEASSSSWVATALTAAVANSYLVLACCTQGFGVDFTFPDTMVPLTERDTGFNTYRTAIQPLSGSGSTGTRTVGLSAAANGAIAKFIIRPAAATADNTKFFLSAA